MQERRTAASRVLGWLALLAALAAPPMASEVLAAPKSSERQREKQRAESERAELRRKLADLKADIARTEKAQGRAADALAASEAAISDARRALRDLAQEQQHTEQQLQLLANNQQELEVRVARQRDKLGKMLREQYAAGHDDRVRLLLSGDNPNRIARELRYLGYVSAEQMRAIEQLQRDIAEIEASRADAEQARAELEEIAAEQREQQALLEKEKAKRQALVRQLAGKLSTQRREAGNLARDEERLSALVGRLAVLVEKQRKAEQAAAQRRARARAEAEAAARERAKQARPGSASGKPPVVAKADPRAPAPPDTAEPPPPPDGAAFAALRGKARMPVNGELAAAFGTRRADGPAWKGIFIKAAEGSDVRAAGAGEVIFADWMRGFGNLIIVDHGGQYMSIYGNNQALLKQPGDRVKTGESIATVGNSGGNEHSGLYFEIRHQGRAIDPLTWINR